MAASAQQTTQREDCEFYSVLGTGTKTSTFQVTLRAGKFHDARGGQSTDSGKPYSATIDELQAWIRKERPERAAEVLSDGDFVFNARTAATIMQLAREWRASPN